MKFEVALLPVADTDRAKALYQGLGWRQDADIVISDDYRIVQLTPTNSAASIQFGTGLTTMTPGSVRDLYLVVEDVEAARNERISHGAVVPGCCVRHQNITAPLKPSPRHMTGETGTRPTWTLVSAGARRRMRPPRPAAIWLGSSTSSCDRRG